MDIEKYIEEFKIKDYTNFDDFYNQTVKSVYFTAQSILKDPSLTDDIVQDTYISFLENVDKYHYNLSINAFLSVIARNKSINVYNRNKKVSYDDEYIKSVPGSLPSDISKFTAEDIISLLKNEEEREIVTYHIILDYKFKDIAKILDKPLGTVLWRYNKAIKQLKEEVKQYEN